MNDKSKQAQGGFNLATVLFLIFMTLKLTNYIDWSWWWVTSPLWIPVALLVLILVLALCFGQIFKK